MITRFFFLLGFLIIFNKGYSQKFNIHSKVEYEVFIQPDSTDINSKVKLETFTLLIGSENSMFISSNRFKLDSLIYGINPSKDLGLLMNMPKPSFNKRIIRDNFLNKNIIYEEISRFLYKIEEIGSTLKWKIEKDTIIRNNYVLRKAITNYKGRMYLAWFSYDIPISAGPYKFNGLPGLIFEVYDVKNHYTFKLLNFKKSDNLTMEFSYDNHAKIVTNKEFLKLKREYSENPIPFMESEGAVFNEETKRIIKNKFKEMQLKNNNPIELTD